MITVNVTSQVAVNTDDAYDTAPAILTHDPASHFPAWVRAPVIEAEAIQYPVTHGRSARQSSAASGFAPSDAARFRRDPYAGINRNVPDSPFGGAAVPAITLRTRKLDRPA